MRILWLPSIARSSAFSTIIPKVAQDKLSIVTNRQLTLVNENLANVTTDLAEIKSAVSNNEFDAEISAAREEIEHRDFPLAKLRLSRLRRDKSG